MEKEYSQHQLMEQWRPDLTNFKLTTNYNQWEVLIRLNNFKKAVVKIHYLKKHSLKQMLHLVETKIHKFQPHF